MNESKERVLVNREGEARIERTEHTEKQSRFRPTKGLFAWFVLAASLVAAWTWIVHSGSDEVGEHVSVTSLDSEPPSVFFSTAAAVRLNESSGPRQQDDGTSRSPGRESSHDEPVRPAATVARPASPHASSQRSPLHRLTALSNEGIGPSNLIFYFAYDCPWSRKHAQVLDYFFTGASPRAKRIEYRVGTLDDRTEPLAMASIGVAGDSLWPVFHSSLVRPMSSDVQTVEDLLQRAANDSGLDRGRLERLSSLPSTRATLDHHAELAKQSNVKGFPSYFVSGRKVDLYEFLKAFDRVSIREVNRAARKFEIL